MYAAMHVAKRTRMMIKMFQEYSIQGFPHPISGAGRENLSQRLHDGFGTSAKTIQMPYYETCKCSGA